jgi:putative transposase
MDALTKTVQKADLEHHIEGAFGQAPFDIYSYKGIYLHTENGLTQVLRHKMVLLYETGEYTQKDIALLFNCSEWVVKKWIRRYREYGPEGLKDLSRAPHRREIKVTFFVKEWVRDLITEFPYMGSRRIAHMIERRYDYKINHLSVSQIMKELRPKKERVVCREIEVQEPNLIWHMDMTQLRIFKGRKQYIFGVVDACTRQVPYVMNYSRKSAKSAIECLEWALKKADETPKELWTDNGLMFTSKAFRAFVKKRGIKQVFIAKRSPWQNGKVERFFRTLKEEWIAYRRFQTPESLMNSLKEFRRWYNGEREIQKLEYRTPNEISRQH